MGLRDWLGKIEAHGAVPCCPTCQRAVSADAPLCIECGTVLREDSEPRPGKRRITTELTEVDAGWTATSPEYPGIVASGLSKGEAVSNLKLALERHLRIIPTGTVQTEALAESDVLCARISASTEAWIGRADEIEVKFQAFEKLLPDIERLMYIDSAGVFVTFPILEFLANCYAGKLDWEGVDRIVRLLSDRGQEHNFSSGFMRIAVSNLEIAVKFAEEVKLRPGITQFAARENLGIEKGDAQRVLKYMEAFGTVSRTGTARTNRLYPGNSLGNLAEAAADSSAGKTKKVG